MKCPYFFFFTCIFHESAFSSERASSSGMRTSAISLCFFFSFSFLLALILCSSALVTAADLSTANVDLMNMNLVAYKHKHKHSGFTAAECPNACQFRCSKTAYKKPCLFFCQKCCFKCKCVPPGTYAHKEVCPCYNNWKTQSGGPKCP